MWIDWERKATEFFESIAAKEKKPTDMMYQHKELVCEMVRLKKRIKNPVNMKTGAPLAESTVNNFIKDVESIRAELRRYQFIIKWLRVCGFWRGYKWKSELSFEQEYIRSKLEGYIRRERELSELRKKYQDLKSCGHKDWRWMAKNYEELFLEQKELCEALKHKLAVSESNYNPEPKKKKRPNDIGLKILAGGKGFEEKPPFAN